MPTYEELITVHTELKQACIDNAPDDFETLDHHDQIRLIAIIDSPPETTENTLNDIDFLSTFLGEWFPDMADDEYQDEIGDLMNRADLLLAAQNA